MSHRTSGKCPLTDTASAIIGISPMTNLSVNLDASLHIHKDVFSNNGDTPRRTDNACNTGVDGSPKRTSPLHRMFSGENIANNSPSSPFRNLFVQSPMIQTPNKENVTDDTPLFNVKSHSPRCRNSSKFLVGRNIFKDRHPLEDHDSNSLDSGYGNSNASISSDDLNKYQDNFRFIEPYGPAPRKNNGSEFSPKSNMYSTSPSSPSVLTQTKFLSFSTGSSDLSDDGFMDQLQEEISSSSCIIDDENAQLPPDIDSLLTGKIFQRQDIESPVSSLAFNKDEGVQRNFKRFLNSGFGEKKLTRTVSLRSTNSPDDDMILLDKDVPSNKRCATENEDNSTPFLKRRKPCSKLNVHEKVMFASQPSTAPAGSDNERRTLFDYGFKNSKFHRSFSETEATIKQAVQKASSNPNLIGDMSRPFALPLIQLSRHSDLKNISCNTLARLINGEFKNTVESYMIVDCRYPYEYKGGHIKGAVNVYTKQQIVERFIKSTEVVAPSSCDNANDDLDVTIVSPDSLIQENPKRNILVFHCEFSSERGPTLSRYLRSADRNKNTLRYPHLDYPEVYLLDGGYSEFFKTHKHLCEPCSYLPMLHPSYTAELRALRRRSKSWASSGPPDYKSKTSSLRTRLGF